MDKKDAELIALGIEEYPLSKLIKHPLQIGTGIEFKEDKFFIQGTIKGFESNGFGYVYDVVGGRGGDYKVREGNVLVVLKNQTQATVDMVNHPAHYGGENNPLEVIKIIDHYELGFALANSIKYILRADKKGNKLEDLKKAAWYLQHEIKKLENV